MKKLFVGLFLLGSISDFSYAQGVPLKNQEHKALIDYLEDDFTEINTYLRKGHEGNDLLEKQISLVSLAIKNLDKFDGVTYRGACISNIKRAGNYLKVGSTVVDPGFVSTSKNIEIAYDFIDGNEGCTPILMRVIGSSAADVSKYAKTHLGEDSLQYEEEEVLYNHGTEFEVTSVQKEKNEYYGEINVIHLNQKFWLEIKYESSKLGIKNVPDFFVF